MRRQAWPHFNTNRYVILISCYLCLLCSWINTKYQSRQCKTIEFNIGEVSKMFLRVSSVDIDKGSGILARSLLNCRCLSHNLYGTQTFRPRRTAIACFDFQDICGSKRCFPKSSSRELIFFLIQDNHSLFSFLVVCESRCFLSSRYSVFRLSIHARCLFLFFFYSWRSRLQI